MTIILALAGSTAIGIGLSAVCVSLTLRAIPRRER